MTFSERMARQLKLIYDELINTPPLVLLFLSCLALALVGAILIGATR